MLLVDIARDLQAEWFGGDNSGKGYYYVVLTSRKAAPLSLET